MESIMRDVLTPVFDRPIEDCSSKRRSRTLRQALVVLSWLTVGSACIDLTPPPQVVNYRNGFHSGTGGGGAGETGAGGGLGVPGSGGAVTGGTTSAAVAGGGAGGRASGGAIGTAGTTQPAGSGGAGIDARGLGDVPPGTGGAGGAGGVGGTDGEAGAGGGAGTGGTEEDVFLGTGGEIPDAPIGAGGVTSDGDPQPAGGVQGMGGQTGSGGIERTGGATATGGIDGAGGVTGAGGTIPAGGTAGTGGITGFGGTIGAGGATSAGGTNGTGGTTSTVIPPYSCASAIVPPGGVVTDSADWTSSPPRWGSGTLTGNVYQYAGGSASMNAAKVEGNPLGLHLTGSVPSGAYGGGGLTFFSCVTVASFSRISFDIYGSAANCAIELQIQTYDQRPVEQIPAGGCKSDGGSSCFRFPLKSQIVSLSSTVSPPGNKISTTLSSFSNWSATPAGQIVGLQWQFTSSNGTCTPNATFTNIEFLQ
jgi:hypothetical protein